MKLPDQVANTLRRRIRLPRGARVMAAVSGGADSVALAWLLAELAGRGAFEFAGMAHLNHQLRGADADADEAFCAALAGRLGVPFRAARVDVAALASAHGESIEAAARRARYAWLADAAAELTASHTATGHTLEDQAETVLLRLLRGAGSRGLSGIRAVRGPVIRPLLDCRRADVRAYLVARGQVFREDTSNTDVTIPRNLLRRDLLPVIDRVAPSGLEALARTAALAADDEEYLSSHAVIAARSVVLTGGDGVQLKREALAALPAAVARRVIRGAVELAAPLDAPRLTSRHIEAVWRMASTMRARHVDLPGVRVEGDRHLLGLRAEAADERHRSDKPFTLTLDVPGTLTIVDAGWRISAERRHQTLPAGVEAREALRIAVPASLVCEPLTVRSRLPGDRIKPLGAFGRKKVQDLFVDRKVPRADRERRPLLVDANGWVVWVVGVAMADQFRVTEPEAEVVIFNAERQ